MNSRRSFEKFYIWIGAVLSLCSGALIGTYLAYWIVDGRLSGSVGGFAALFGFGAIVMLSVGVGEMSYGIQSKYYTHGPKRVLIKRGVH